MGPCKKRRDDWPRRMRKLRDRHEGVKLENQLGVLEPYLCGKASKFRTYKKRNKSQPKEWFHFEEIDVSEFSKTLQFSGKHRTYLMISMCYFKGSLIVF